MLDRFGDIPRDDVALVLYHCLFAQDTVHAKFDLLSGAEPIESGRALIDNALTSRRCSVAFSPGSWS